jgi:hypothetical protein
MEVCDEPVIVVDNAKYDAMERHLARSASRSESHVHISTSQRRKALDFRERGQHHRKLTRQLEMTALGAIAK